MDQHHYVIRGGIAGRERLRLLARVMRPMTNSLFERVGIGPGKACLDVGCGGGDVTFDLARIVGDQGRVTGIDIDAVKIEMAGGEAREQGLRNVAFRVEDIRVPAAAPAFDIVYARFLLTHLPDPGAAVREMRTRLRPHGMIIVEDIDFAGSFCYPSCEAYQKYCDLYSETVRRRGGDPDIGRRLPALLLEAGLSNVGMHILQPSALEKDVKQINPVTMENIADAVVEEKLATREEIQAIVEELYQRADDPSFAMSVPRLVQAWGSTS